MDDETIRYRLYELKHDPDWWDEYAQYPSHAWGGETDIVEPLADLLDASDDERIRKRATDALCWIEDDAVLSHVTSALEDASPLVRKTAAWGLRRFDAPEAVTALREAAETESDGAVRQRVGRVLGLLDWDRQAEYALEAFDAECGTDFLEALLANFSGGPARTVASDLIERLDDGDPDAASVARALGLLGDELAIGPLVDLLDDSDPAVRGAAATAFGDLDDPVAVSHLDAVALSDPSANVRAAATESLGPLLRKSPDAEALDVLGPLLDDSDPAVRRLAAYHLRQSNTDATVGRLIPMLGDSDPKVRAATAWSLKVQGHPAAVPALVDLLDERPDDPEVRLNAALAMEWIAGDLGQLDSSDFDLFETRELPGVPGIEVEPNDPDRDVTVLRGALDDPDEEVRSTVVDAIREAESPPIELGRGGDELTDILPESLRGRTVDLGTKLLLEALLTHEDGRVRSRALYRLRPDEPAFEPVVLEAARDESPLVRKQAARSVRQYDDEAATEALCDLLADPDPEVRLRTAKNTRFLDDPDPAVVETLESLLVGDPDPSVRIKAAKALYSLRDERWPPEVPTEP